LIEPGSESSRNDGPLLHRSYPTSLCDLLRIRFLSALLALIATFLVAECDARLRVTDNGCTLLTRDAPVAMAEIEVPMRG
jgi:hypothetical protein